jgi:hypothetical protein
MERTMSFLSKLREIGQTLTNTGQSLTKAVEEEEARIASEKAPPPPPPVAKSHPKSRQGGCDKVKSVF